MFMDQIRPKGRQVHGAHLGQEGRFVLMHPPQPNLEARQITEISVDSGRREVAIGQVLAKRVKEVGIGVWTSGHI